VVLTLSALSSLAACGRPSHCSLVATFLVQHDLDSYKQSSQEVVEQLSETLEATAINCSVGNLLQNGVFYL